MSGRIDVINREKCRRIDGGKKGRAILTEEHNQKILSKFCKTVMTQQYQ
jgi:hypothetical protein